MPLLLQEPESNPEQLAERLGLLDNHDEDSLEKLIADLLETYPDKVSAYKKGKKGLIGFFMGQLMRKTESKVDPKVANELLSKYLD